MKAEQIIELTSSQPEKKLETVARVQDPVNGAAPPQLNEQDLENRDDYSDSDSDDESIPESALIDELERAEFEPYTDDGWLNYSFHCLPPFHATNHFPRT